MMSPIELGSATEKIEDLLAAVLRASALDLTYELKVTAESDRPRIRVVFEGNDTRMLVARNAELLHALEALAVDVLRLSPEDHELISFDAEGYKAQRAERMRRAAGAAVASVQSTGRPYAFPPMNSRERRMLHLELMSSGLRTASSGEASRRFVVVYPAAQAVTGTPNDGQGREKRLRNAFRPRL